MTTPENPTSGQPAVKDVEALQIAFVSMSGTYNTFPGAMNRLLAWLQAEGINVTGPPGGTFLNAPSLPEDELRWEAWFPVADEIPERPTGPDGIGVRTVPGGRYGWIVNTGPYGNVAASYGLLFTWLAQQQIQLAGPPMEVYLSDPAETPEADLITEVRVQIV